VVHAYRRAFFSTPSAAKIVTVRAGNVVGGGDWSRDRLIPDLVRAGMSRCVAVIRSPDAIRPWQHVLEPLSGYMRLAQFMWDGGDVGAGINFGPDIADEIPVGDVAARFIRAWGGGLDVVHAEQPSALAETGVLRLNSEHARTVLDWRPRWNVETAIREAVRWYRQYADGDDMRRVTLAQIRTYDSPFCDGR
jgi:CDP-glucose 4,6-dehydratase